uniref:Cobalt-precorrin 5A hydrolase n=1 Tax=Candidatus Kentrum sp. FW TaxID=2126338 RepID=A0A450SSE9_9GAMM|nr:MAG: cobalt-precorrin 5A hydrolase [Candidatus Kentron sp. FW]
MDHPDLFQEKAKGWDADDKHRALSPQGTELRTVSKNAGPHLTVLVSLTRGGAIRARNLATHMPDAHVLIPRKFRGLFDGLDNEIESYDGPLRIRIGTLFSRYDRIVFFLSLGTVVRLVAPHLDSKYRDPAVVSIDDAGRFVIPVLSGHVGGANDLARQLAEILGATPVITTASDVNRTLSVDILGRELGWRVVASPATITRVSAHVVNGEPVAFVQEIGSRAWWPGDTPLPSNIHLFECMEDVDPDGFEAVLWVTSRGMDETLQQRLSGRVVVYRPQEWQEPAGSTRKNP